MACHHTDRLATVVDNLANVSTVGFKKSYAVQPPFYDILEAKTTPIRRAPDFSQGPIRATGQPFDFAIDGSGFFVVEKDGRDYYTRNGQFKQGPDGTLMTAGGLPVQGTDGRITFPREMNPADLTVDRQGNLYAGEQTLGRLRLVDFANPETLKNVGPTTFATPISATRSIDFAGAVHNRALEGSNASVFEEMAELISTVRSHESCMKMLQAHDETERKMVKTYT